MSPTRRLVLQSPVVTAVCHHPHRWERRPASVTPDWGKANMRSAVAQMQVMMVQLGTRTVCLVLTHAVAAPKHIDAILLEASIFLAQD